MQRCFNLELSHLFTAVVVFTAVVFTAFVVFTVTKIIKIGL